MTVLYALENRKRRPRPRWKKFGVQMTRKATARNVRSRGGHGMVAPSLLADFVPRVRNNLASCLLRMSIAVFFLIFLSMLQSISYFVYQFEPRFLHQKFLIFSSTGTTLNS